MVPFYCLQSILDSLRVSYTNSDYLIANSDFGVATVKNLERGSTIEVKVSVIGTQMWINFEI